MEGGSPIIHATPVLTIGPHTRAAIARETRDELRDHEVIYVDRRGPRVLRIPSFNPPMPLDRKILRDLENGIYSGDLSKGTKFLATRMIKNGCLMVSNDGKYSIKRQLATGDDMDVDPPSFQTLDIWTGKLGTCTDRDIDKLEFYSVDEDELPSFHSWKGDKLARIEGPFEEGDNNRVLKRPPLKISLDEFRRDHFAKIDEDAANDPENLLRHKPGITPSDPNWQGVEEYFRWILEEERKRNRQPQVHKIISEEFVISQQLLLHPASDRSYRARIQKDNTRRYEKFLGTVFKEKEDNLITKLTMLCFGLPIAPLTPANIEYAGGPQDKLGAAPESNSNDDAPAYEQTMWSEKPLEFLDRYNERSYGYPILRTKKKHYNDYSVRQGQKHLEMGKKTWKAMRQGGRPSGGFGRPICGNSLLNWRNGELKRNLKIGKYKETLPPNKQNLHIRGGAGDPTSTFHSKRFLVYCAMGKFQIEDDIVDFQRLVYRLFRTNDGNGCMIDLIPEISTTFGSTANTTTIAWNNVTSEIFIQEISPRLNDKIKWRVRIRSGGESTDDCEPVEQNLVDLRVDGRDDDVAYWRVPLNTADIQGINQKQDTFRNAVECLFQYHWEYVLTWKIRNIPDRSGRLVLAAEAPSENLWKTTLSALNAGQYVIIDLAVKSHTNRTPRLIIPGVVNTDNSMPISFPTNQRNPEGFATLRTLVQDQTQPHKTAIRIWPKLESYAADTTSDPASSLVIGVEPEEGDDMDWSSETIVARPEILEFHVIDQQSPNNTQLWSISHGSTLSEFRKAITKLWVDYEPMTEYFGIIQLPGNETFIIGPEMTELQWRFQVFNWFRSSNIYVKRKLGTSLYFSQQCILGPLGETFSAGNTAEEKSQSTATGSANVIPSRTVVADETAQGASREGQTARRNSNTNKWMQQYDRQYSQMQARRDAYVQDSSIYRGSNTPQISIFGRSRESNIAVGPSGPSIFTNPVTPSEAARLRDQNRILQNMAIDRQEVCQTCNEPLPPRNYNDTARSQHLESHTQLLRNAQNSSGNAEETFYCEICGSSTVDIERENPGQGATHAKQCGKMNKYHNIPHFCQYCGLDIWGDGSIPDTSATHIGNCAFHRRVTLQGREQLYQKLLQRATGQRDHPQGAYTCHFQNCKEVFTTATPNVGRGRHLLKHLDNGHNEKLSAAPQPPVQKLCQFPECGVNISNFSESDVVRHLDEHNRERCPFAECNYVFSSSTSEDERVQHLITHTRNRCQFPGCSYVFTDGSSEEEQRQHLLTHTRARCQFPGCRYIFADENSEDEHRQHLLTHTTIVSAVQRPQPAQPLENPDTVPPRVLNQYPGAKLYCPYCLFAVTGNAKSMCRRHRKAPCNVQGHDSWLALTATQLQARKDQKRQAEQQNTAGVGVVPQEANQGGGEAPQNPSSLGEAATPAQNPHVGRAAGVAAAATTRETRAQKRRNASDDNNGNDAGGNGGEGGSNAGPSQKRARKT